VVLSLVLLVGSMAALEAKLPLLAATAFAREDFGAPEDMGWLHSRGNCSVGADGAWTPPTAAQVAADAVPAAGSCAAQGRYAAEDGVPCCCAAVGGGCTATGRLYYPSSCPVGIAQLAPAASLPDNNWHYPFFHVV
jgi:hypothetical protein